MNHRFPNQVPYLTWCAHHRKRAFTKGNAKKVRRMLPKAEGMCVYQCRFIQGGWHTGHLPKQVVRGEVTRGEWYGPEAA